MSYHVEPSVLTAFAYGGCSGRFCRRALSIAVEVVPKPDGQKGFAVLPRRWVVERTFAWLVRTDGSITTINGFPPPPRR